MVSFRIRLPAEQAAVALKAIEAARDALDGMDLEDVSACMDSSSFARGSVFWLQNRLLTCIRSQYRAVARDHDGLFARWLPSGNTGFLPTAESGFCQRRSDLFAVNQTPSQSWVGCS
jgi:hypothetical protein